MDTFPVFSQSPDYLLTSEGPLSLTLEYLEALSHVELLLFFL